MCMCGLYMICVYASIGGVYMFMACDCVYLSTCVWCVYDVHASVCAFAGGYVCIVYAYIWYTCVCGEYMLCICVACIYVYVWGVNTVCVCYCLLDCFIELITYVSLHKKYTFSQHHIFLSNSSGMNFLVLAFPNIYFSQSFYIS